MTLAAVQRSWPVCLALDQTFRNSPQRKIRVSRQ
jgi:hypothetical protein